MVKIVEAILERSWRFTLLGLFISYLLLEDNSFTGHDTIVIAGISVFVGAMVFCFSLIDFHESRKLDALTYRDIFSVAYFIFDVATIGFILFILLIGDVSKSNMFVFVKFYYAACFILAIWVLTIETNISVLKTFVFAFCLSPLLGYIVLCIYQKKKEEQGVPPTLGDEPLRDDLDAVSSKSLKEPLEENKKKEENEP